MDSEVSELLEFYGLEEKYATVKEWYDGYQFGNADVYCPWDVINYVDLLLGNPNARPKAFWINTSGNDIIRTFLQMAKGKVRREIEELVNGKTVLKKINEELTYRDLYKSIDNIWEENTLEAGCEEALEQVGSKNYEAKLLQDGIKKVYKYGIVCWKKECRVRTL